MTTTKELESGLNDLERRTTSTGVPNYGPPGGPPGIGAFRASGQFDLDKFLTPRAAVPNPTIPLQSPVSNYLERASNGISAFSTPVAPDRTPTGPIVVAALPERPLGAFDDRLPSEKNSGQPFNPPMGPVDTLLPSEKETRRTDVYRERLKAAVPPPQERY